jgi:hypothetical protein
MGDKYLKHPKEVLREGLDWSPLAQDRILWR